MEKKKQMFRFIFFKRENCQSIAVVATESAVKYSFV